MTKTLGDFIVALSDEFDSKALTNDPAATKQNRAAALTMISYSLGVLQTPRDGARYGSRYKIVVRAAVVGHRGRLHYSLASRLG